jgi:LysM repeat protein
MNFVFDYVKHKSKPRNDGFYFDIETPRGHFFTVLDFAGHDYANLNPSLQGKLETIISSFGSVSSFSADLFLGFLAKEINNFVHNLAAQSGGPELFCSAALCLVNDNQLSYFLRGDTRVSILSGGRLQPLLSESSPESEPENKTPAQLGAENLEDPLSAQVQDVVLREDDIVLIMTRGVAEAVENQESPAERWNLLESDAQVLCDSLMNASAASSADRTLVVITGPYEEPVEPTVAELSQSIAALEAKLKALTESEERRNLDSTSSEASVEAQFEQKFTEQVAELKEYLRTKAATIDLLELDEKVTGLSATLARKADTAEVLELQRDVLKLGLVSSVDAPKEPVAETESSIAAEAARAAVVRESEAIPTAQIAPPASAFTLNAALVVLILSLSAGFIGGWLGSRRPRTAAELWSVKATENQITIVRKDGVNRGSVTLNVSQPLNATGEQTFSSFADVQRYIETITNGKNPSAQTSQSSETTPQKESQASVGVTEIRVKSGDTLQRLAQVYKVSPEKLMELNPSIDRWPSIRIGQKIVVPSSAPSASTPTPTPAPAGSTGQPDQPTVTELPADTTVVTVGPGDSLNELARRFNTTADHLRRLNPNTKWPRIQSGQKVLVPAPAGD